MSSILETVDCVLLGPTHFFCICLPYLGSHQQARPLSLPCAHHTHPSEASVRATWSRQPAWLIWAQRCQKRWKREEGTATVQGHALGSAGGLHWIRQAAHALLTPSFFICNLELLVVRIYSTNLWKNTQLSLWNEAITMVFPLYHSTAPSPTVLPSWNASL